MTYENYQETNPNKYKLSNGQIITEVDYKSLLRSFEADYNAIKDYATEEEKEKVTNLYLNAEFEAYSYEYSYGNRDEFDGIIESKTQYYQSAMEFDKYARLVAYTHFNSIDQVFEKKRTNAFEDWFEDITEEQKAEIRNQNNKKVEQQILKENEQEENLEYEQIIHSKDFIEKFGDWEKAQRLEKAKTAPTIEKDGEIVIDGKSITEDIKQAREEKDYDQLRLYANKIFKSVRGTFQATDLNNENIQVVKNTANEIKTHNITNKYSVEAIKYIPDFIDKGIYVSSEKNEDIVTHADIDKYEYLLSGLNVSGEDYTVKSVIAVQKNGDKYYDQNLSKIEKGKLISDLTKLNQLESSINLPYNVEDKRLLRICQVSQRPYLDENLKPTQEAVKLVQEGKLYLEKDSVTGFTSMCNENECNPKILQFRNMFNAQQKAHEPKITYENAEDILTFCATASLNEYCFPKNMNGKIVKCFLDENNSIESESEYTPKELLNQQILTVDNRLYYASESDLSKPNYKMMLHMKNIAEQNTHAENCSKIIENWIDACGVLGESKNFENVTKHAKDTFRQNIENAKNNLSKLDDSFNKYEKKSAENLVSFNKDEFEYFKHNAKPLFDNAVENIRLRDEINNQKELSNRNEFSELTKKVEQQENTIQKQNQLLYGETKVEVNGVTRTCPNGIVEGFAKSVARNDEQNQRIKRQNQKIENLNNYIDSITNTKDSINPNKPEPKDPKSPCDDGMSF